MGSTVSKILGLARLAETEFRRYAQFSGRTGRPEYWSFVLFLALILLVASGAQVVLQSGESVQSVVSLLLLLPLFAATTRRLHDTGRSGWRQLLWLVPLGLVFLVVWTVQAGTIGPNRYGPRHSPDAGDASPSGAALRRPSRVTHVDAHGRVLTGHLRSETCPICTPDEDRR
jgi:uncharacterized membrane protein YhaH (DUF805 family)